MPWVATILEGLCDHSSCNSFTGCLLTFCRLSGYENVLLGYKTRHYKLLREHVEFIDVIMFGMALMTL